MYLAAVSQYAASEEFAEIVNASSGAKRYIEEGILVPDEISDGYFGTDRVVFSGTVNFLI